MALYVILALAVGLSVVLQGGWNRQLAEEQGLAGAGLMNGLVFLGACVAFYVFARWRPDALPLALRAPDTPHDFLQWRAFLPGLLGAVIVFGIPWSMTRLGALVVILLVLSAQLVAALVWDLLVEGIAPTAWRVAGSAVALAGAALATWKS